MTTDSRSATAKLIEDLDAAITGPCQIECDTPEVPGCRCGALMLRVEQAFARSERTNMAEPCRHQECPGRFSCDGGLGPNCAASKLAEALEAGGKIDTAGITIRGDKTQAFVQCPDCDMMVRCRVLGQCAKEVQHSIAATKVNICPEDGNVCHLRICNSHGCREKAERLETLRATNTPDCRCARHPEPHERQRLCEITGFNLFLGEVQRRLLEEGYDPPIWPMPSISDQGDLDAALDSCTQWCKDRLDDVAAAREARDFNESLYETEKARTSSSTANVEPDGYAVLIDDKASSPKGYWFAYAYIGQAEADRAAEICKGRVAPIFFARSARSVGPEEKP